MDTKKIEKLIELAKLHGLNEIEVEEGDARVRITLNGPTMVPAVQNWGLASQPQAVAPVTAKAPEVVAAKNIVRSPLVGTYYSAPGPNAPAFVEVGKKVRKGEKLCIVEAMKMMNEIEAEHDMVIAELLIKNGQPVQYDQALFSYE